MSVVKVRSAQLQKAGKWGVHVGIVAIIKDARGVLLYISGTNNVCAESFH